MSLIDRYVTGQLLRPMLAILVGALLLLLAERTLRVVDIVVGWRGSLFVIFEMIGYLVPHYAGLAIPAALFIAILLTVSRLSRDGELDAMLSAGAGFKGVLRPLILTSLVLAGLNGLVQSHLQPWSRYAYRSALFALSNVSFQVLLNERQFATLGQTTYSVDRLDAAHTSFGGVFLATERDDGGLVIVTARAGQVKPAADGLPTTLQLQDGVQQFSPAARADGRPSTAPATLRFRNFSTDLRGGQPSGLRPRGQDEREFTLPELFASDGDPQRGINPEEIAAELHARLVRIAATLVLPLVAMPLAITRARTRRSWGFLVGIAVLLAFNQALQVGKTLADDDQISVWLGLWLPFAALTALGLTLCWRMATRVPSGTGANAVERGLDRSMRILTRPLARLLGSRA